MRDVCDHLAVRILENLKQDDLSETEQEEKGGLQLPLWECTRKVSTSETAERAQKASFQR